MFVALFSSSYLQTKANLNIQLIDWQSPDWYRSCKFKYHFYVLNSMQRSEISVESWSLTERLCIFPLRILVHIISTNITIMAAILLTMIVLVLFSVMRTFILPIVWRIMTPILLSILMISVMINSSYTVLNVLITVTLNIMTKYYIMSATICLVILTIMMIVIIIRIIVIELGSCVCWLFCQLPCWLV